jgi:hypothetical protein
VRVGASVDGAVLTSTHHTHRRIDHPPHITRSPRPPLSSSSSLLQWDVWISRGNGPEMEERAKKFVVDMAVARLEEGSDAQVIHIYM